MWIRTCFYVSSCFNSFFCPGAEKAAECSKMVSSLVELQEELFSLMATQEMLDKSDKEQLKGWLKHAGDCFDLAVNVSSLGKANKLKFQNYLSS